MPHQNFNVGLHRRQNGWNDFVSGIQGAWSNFNPFQDRQTTPPKAVGPSTIYQTVVATVTEGNDGPISSSPPDGGDGGSSTEVMLTDTTPISQAAQTTSKHQATLPASYIPTSQTIPSTLATATDIPTQASAGDLGASSTADATLNTDGGSSDVSIGAKAGIAIGVLAGILGVFLLAFFVFQKRRKQLAARRLDDDEKNNNNPFADQAAISHSGNDGSGRAPRLSLRPVTQFMPNLNRQSRHPDRRTSRGAMIAMVQNPQSPHPPAAGVTLWDRPMTSSSNHRDNPFGNHAERLPTPVAEEASGRSMTVSPVSARDGEVGVASTTGTVTPPSPIHGDQPAAVAAVAAGAVAGAAAAGLTRKASIRKDGPPALDLTLPPSLSAVPPSPAGTEFSVSSVAPGQAPGPSASAAAIAAAGGPPTSAVHRVQLDFKPTLEDEMELRAGQLVRLLHEYDDGWALCIRLDRSQQGVVPRTCLSTRPVKPRPPQNGGPRGPPVNPQRGPNYPPGQRPLTPQGPLQGPPHGPPPQGPPPAYPRSQSPMRPGSAPGGRPQSPAGRRPQSPAGRPMSPHGRPASPAGRAMSPGPRSQSPAPRYQPGRPQSPSGMNRRHSPPGPSQMNQQYRPGPGGPPTGPVGRKPVPGQAY